jgi:hypothetical protein
MEGSAMADQVFPSEDTDDPLIGEFIALWQAVAEQVRAMARLETALGEARNEIARKTGPEQFKETFAAIRQDMALLAQRMERQEAALGMLPDGTAIGAAIREGTAGLVQDNASTRSVVRESMRVARAAGEDARNAARDAADHARELGETIASDRVTIGLTLAAMLVLAVLGGISGWSLRGWWAPPPDAVFARYLDAGNNADWLLCDGGKNTQRFTDNGNPACDLRFWLAKPGP